MFVPQKNPRRCLYNSKEVGMIYQMALDIDLDEDLFSK